MCKNIKALNTSTTWTIILITFMTIFSELSPSFKDLLKSITGHHWLTKSVVSIVFFFLIYLSFSKTKTKLKTEDIRNTIITTLVGFLAITLFYVWHYF